MNKVYQHARQAFLRGEVDVTTDDLGAIVVNDATLGDETNQFVADLAPGVYVAPAVTLASVAIDSTEAWVLADDVTFPDVAVADPIAGLIVYQDTGSDATSRLLAWMDHRADTMAVSITPTGGDITCRFLDSKVFRL